MANNRELGNHRQAPIKATQKKTACKESSASCTSQHNLKNDEETISHGLFQESQPCSKKTSQHQTNSLNPYRAAQPPGEEEDDDDNDNEDDEDNDEDIDEDNDNFEEEDDEEDKEKERSSTKKTSSNTSTYGQDRPVSDKTHQPCRNSQQQSKKK